MIGDSTMFQTHGTFASLIYQSKTIPNKQEALQCVKQISFQMSDYLVHHPQETRGLNLIQTMKQANYDYDIIILATGGHYSFILEEDKKHNITEDHPAFGNNFFPKLKADIQMIRNKRQELYPNKSKITFIYKTENTGHPQCMEYKQPLTTVYDHDLLSTSKYHWENGLFMYKAFLRFAAEHELEVLYMDPLYKRPESHPGIAAKEDCYHYCTPGPLNLFARLVYMSLLTGEI